MEEKDLYLWGTSRCAVKEYCCSEIASKLAAKGATSEQIDTILNRLQDEHYIDEARYAAAFASDKFRFDHWGRIKISQALRLKGITQHIISEALHNSINEDEYRIGLLDFIKNKRRTTKAANDFTLKQKVARAAISRGYEPPIVFAALSLDEEVM